AKKSNTVRLTTVGEHPTETDDAKFRQRPIRHTVPSTLSPRAKTPQTPSRFLLPYFSMEDLAVLSGRGRLPSSSASSVFPRHRRRIILHVVLRPSSSSPFPCRGRCRLTSMRRVRAMAAGDGQEGLSWEGISGSLRRGSERFLSGFGERLRRETGLDLGVAGAEVGGMVDAVGEVARNGLEAVDQIRLDLVPRFVDWNKWERWKID
ncbi:hypothetical protein Taro_006273, partial [Colocasia esculenta]|nr:hypothetical protein [Colocasia esculenta]